jgi:hypothetical protein
VIIVSLFPLSPENNLASMDFEVLPSFAATSMTIFTWLRDELRNCDRFSVCGSRAPGCDNFPRTNAIEGSTRGVVPMASGVTIKIRT